MIDHRAANLRPFRPGQSGNPAGRPKSARSKIGERFLQALHDDFNDHGEGVIVRVREEEPATYLRLVAALLPKEIEAPRGIPLEDATRDELLAVLAVIRQAQAARQAEDGQLTHERPLALA